MFEEHFNVPKTRNDHQRNRTGGPNGIRTRVSVLRVRPDDSLTTWDKVRLSVKTCRLTIQRT